MTDVTQLITRDNF